MIPTEIACNMAMTGQCSEGRRKASSFNPPRQCKIELARERNKRWKAEDATSHDILQNRLRGAYSSSRNVRSSDVDRKSFNERSIPAIDLSLLTTKKPLLVNRSKTKMYLKNTWY